MTGIFLNLDRSFTYHIQRLYGERGIRWLDDLPETIHEVASLYRLSELSPLHSLSYHCVLSGFQNQQAVILKLGVDEDSLRREAAALNAFSGLGAVCLLTDAPGWLLLQRAVPGHSLKTYFPAQDEAAVVIVSEVMRQLHQAPLPQLAPRIQDWLSILDQDWDIVSEDLKRARLLRDRLLANSAKPALLHGDLHHDNILQNDHGWMAIDPKGVIAEPLFEVAAFLRNPIPELLQHPQADMIIRRRIQQFADILGSSYQRIVQWCFVEAVLSQAWALEDNLHDQLDYFKRLTEFFRA